MSLMRAFTTRRNRPEMEMISPNQLGRAASQRAGKPVYRSQISGPVALVSTTNMLSYEAPDIPLNAASTTSSSDEDSDASTLSIKTSVTTVTDASSVENSPTSPTSPNMEPNHLSCYFRPVVDTKSPVHNRSPSNASCATFDTAPVLPKRVPSHSKRAHEHIHRKRSVQRLMSPPASIRSSAEMFSPFTPSRSAFVESPRSPFGSELAQLDEVAEELGTVVRDAEAQSDATVMRTCDLARFAASDYLAEISELASAAFQMDSPTWI